MQFYNAISECFGDTGGTPADENIHLGLKVPTEEKLPLFGTFQPIERAMD